MSYTVNPYLVDLAQLRAVYGCRDVALLTTLEHENATALRRDETPALVWAMRAGVPPAQEVRPPPTPTLRQALREIIAGTVPPIEDGGHYWYAYELLCAHFGDRLPNDQFEAITARGLGVLDEIAIVRYVASSSRQPLPFPLPPPGEFPVITYLMREEVAATLAQVPVVELFTPYEDDWEAWDGRMRRAWEEEWPKRLLIQYRQWLEEATRVGKDVVAFSY
jgi:hypothetical protein